MNKNKNKNLSTIFTVICLTILCFITFTILKVNVRSSSVSESIIFSKINKYRKINKLQELKLNKTLSQAATTKAMDMKMLNYFAHNSPSSIKWNDFIINSGYKYVIAGENLAKGYFTPEELINDWLNSSTHKANIIYPEFTETGIAVVESDSVGVIIVQLFGKQFEKKD